jgi:hypothetical protein
MPITQAPIKCATCGEVTIFEIPAPGPGKSKTFEFRCPKGHLATNPQGGAEVVDLKDYDESKLKRVRL